MLGFLTHYIAGKAAIQGVSPEIQKKTIADERLYNLGTQGFDSFFYYFPGQLRKRSREIVQEMHLGGLELFLAYMARLAKEADKHEMGTIFAFTAGFLMHYVLDCHAHPYVCARVFDKKTPKIKNSAEHRKFETAIDVAMLKLVSGEKPAESKQWELIKASKDRLWVSAAALSQGIKEVYGRDVLPKIVQRAMKDTINFTRVLQSQYGRRKRFMEIVENMTIREYLFLSIIKMQKITGKRDYLNIQKSPWHSPWSPEAEIHNDSFMERYNAAVIEGIQMLEALYEYIYGDLQPVILTETLGNRFLKTGLPCSA